MPLGMRHRPSVAEKCDTRAARAVAARLGYMWRKSKQVERAACDRLLADMGTVPQNRDELADVGPLLSKLAGRGDGVVMPSVQHFALQQQLASLAATVADHETAILELERQVTVVEPLDKRVQRGEGGKTGSARALCCRGRCPGTTLGARTLSSGATTLLKPPSR